MPFTYIEFDSNARLWPGVRQAYDLVDRYQLVNSYGLFRRMTGVSGRPEVVIEGSNDGVSWTVRDKSYSGLNRIEMTGRSVMLCAMLYCTIMEA